MGRHATYTLPAGVFDGTDRGLAAREMSCVGAECKDGGSLPVRERAGGRGGRPAARRSAFVLRTTKGGGVSGIGRTLSGGLTG